MSSFVGTHAQKHGEEIKAPAGANIHSIGNRSPRKQTRKYAFSCYEMPSNIAEAVEAPKYCLNEDRYKVFFFPSS
jgi:hypothetical protein